MSSVEYLSCCGIRELADIRDDDDPQTSILEVDPDTQAFIVFSDVADYNPGYSKGKAIVAEIKKHKLGTVAQLNAAENPNSGNMVKPWMWRINRKNLEKYQAKFKKQRGIDEDDPYHNPWAGY